MSTILRNPWLVASIREKLLAGIAERDGGVVTPGKVLDTIGPLGELQFSGNKFKALQVTQFLRFDDPVTAVLSDKSVSITCRFSSAAKSEYEASNGRITAIKGGIIKLESYEIQFLGVDGKLFWKGVTYQNQIANGPISQKTSNQTKQDHRNTGNGGTIRNGREAEDTKRFFASVPIPEPVLYINSFAFIGSGGSATFGAPTGISSKADIKDLLTKLPRKKYTKQETPVEFKRDRQSMDTLEANLLRKKRNKGPKGQGTGNTTQGPSQKNVLCKPPKSPGNINGLDNELRSQPDINDDDDDGEESQLAFTTQAPGRFSSTYDDLDFSIPADQKKRRETSPLNSSLPSSSFQSTGHPPQVVIITNSQQSRKDSKFHGTWTNTQKKKPSMKSRLVNYSDGTGFDGSTAGSVVNEGGSNGTFGTVSNRQKRKFGSLSESGLVDMKTGNKGASLKVQRKLLENGGWQGMTGITKADVVIPRDQQEILDRPESWYPYQSNQNNQYTSGYSLIPKIQPEPKSHPPRDRVIPPIQVVIPAAPIPSQLSQISSSDDEKLPWPSSPVRSPERDINAMPPDSSMASGSQSHHAGRWSTQGNQQNKGRGTRDSFSVSQQSPTSLKARLDEEDISPTRSSLSARGDSEERDMSESVATGKRVTRAANGISKKALVDPNNVRLSRMAKTSQKPKVSVARKHSRVEPEPDEESDEEYESPVDDVINYPDLPYEVVNRKGRTRVAMFGGILKAQAVGLWEKEKKKARDEEGNTEDEARSDEDEKLSGYDELTWAEELVPHDKDGGKIHDLKEVAQDIVGPPTAKPDSTSNQQQSPQNTQDTKDHPNSPKPPKFRDNPVEIVEGEQCLGTALPSSYSEVVAPLFSPRISNTTRLKVGDKTPEKSLNPSAGLPIAKQINIGTDDEDEISQASFMPLNVVADAKAKPPSTPKRHSPFINRSKEISANLTKITPDNKSQVDMTGVNSLYLKGQPKSHQVLGDNRGTAIFLQTSPIPIKPDVHSNQNSAKTPTSSSLPSSTSNAAPTVQVEETPYRKGCSKMRNSQCLSPTISKSRGSLGYSQDEFDDITLIPGTNTEELYNSSAIPKFRTLRRSTLEQDSSPPEGQVIPPSHVLSSAKTDDGSDDGFPDDFAMSQRQLQLEMKQHMKIEVPATSEVNETRTENVQPLPPSPKKPSKTKKLRRLIKTVDFQSQEIRAASADSDVASKLEQQKRSFLGLKDGCGFGSLDFEDDYSSPLNESLSKKLGAGVSKSHSPVNVIEIGSSSALAPSISYMLIGSDEDVPSSTSKSKIRKRHQSPPLVVPDAAKKLRENDEPPYETENRLAPIHAAQGKAKTPTGSRNESPLTAPIVESVNQDEVESEPEDDEPTTDDIMAGFPAIGPPTDDEFEPTWPPQTPSKPEMYAEIRKRHLYVPGYGKLTDDQKQELDKRRQEYFGTTSHNDIERLFPVKLQRAMQQASLSSSLGKKAKSSETQEVAKTMDEWYRDEDTPLKIFYRKFKELKQVKADLATGGV